MNPCQGCGRIDMAGVTHVCPPLQVSSPAGGIARVATYCDCGDPLAGFEGVLTCGRCGRCYSVSRLPLGAMTSGYGSARQTSCGSCGTGSSHNEGRCTSCGGPWSPRVTL